MIELPAVGTRVVKGKSFGEVESVKAVSDLYCADERRGDGGQPAVVENVQLLAEDPYDLGWLIKLNIDNPAEFGELLDYAAYQKKLAEDAALRAQAMDESRVMRAMFASPTHEPRNHARGAVVQAGRPH